MNQRVSTARTLPENPTKHAFSQVVFVVIGLGIIFGGLWTLYIADAPYHPDADGGIVVAAD